MVQIVPLEEMYPTVYHMLPASEASRSHEVSLKRHPLMSRSRYMSRRLGSCLPLDDSEPIEASEAGSI